MSEPKKKRLRIYDALKNFFVSCMQNVENIFIENGLFKEKKVVEN